jgi:hypothetical protein
MLRSLTILFSVLLLVSCTTTTKKDAGKPGHFGDPGDVLIVMEESLWNGSPGKAVRKALEAPYLVLPQYEGLFSYQHQTPEGFVRYLKNHRNVIFANIADNVDNQESNTRVINEQYARGQIIVEVLAKDIPDFLQEFEDKSSQIIDRIREEELIRIGSIMKKFHKESLSSTLGKDIGVNMYVPEEFEIAYSSDSLVHIPRTKGASDRALAKGVIVYSYPYETDSAFTPEFLLAKRNEVMEAHHIGNNDGSYMTTETIYPPTFAQMDFKGSYAMEMRGLWTLVNDFGGGPFVSIAFLDDVNNRIVTIESYVYAPNTDKRELMREMEGIIHTAELNSSWLPVPPPSE